MLDSRAVRVAVVVGVLGFCVFFFAAMAMDDENQATMMWISYGGLVAALLAGTAAGLVWALKPDADRTNTKEKP